MESSRHCACSATSDRSSITPPDPVAFHEPDHAVLLARELTVIVVVVITRRRDVSHMVGRALRVDLLLIFLLPRASRLRNHRAGVLRDHVRIPAVLAVADIAGGRVHAVVVSQRDAGY